MALSYMHIHKVWDLYVKCDEWLLDFLDPNRTDL